MDTNETNAELAAVNADIINMLIRLNAIMREGQMNRASIEWCLSAMDCITLAGHDIDRAAHWNG